MLFSDKLFDFTDLLKGHYLPIVSSEGDVRLIIMPLDRQTIGYIGDYRVITLYDLILVLKAHSAVDLLHTDCEGELWGSLLWDLPTYEIDLTAI